MAILRSEDAENPSSLELNALSTEDIQGQSWQRFTLTLKTGTYELKLGRFPSDSTETFSTISDCLFCRNPQDEVAELCKRLEALIENDKQQLLFEPSEPSFEISISRTRQNEAKVEVWLDSGNATTGFYSWDAAGIRFHTLQEHLIAFLKEIKQEFAC
ncbi:MAG: hypothetical protein P4L53_10020 [Candidatus Obscuribacterales bacterium]|nr:hypothetical protein [Candidatus Obscuribacterales bacterium]